jgi:YHS domain-containing protein
MMFRLTIALALVAAVMLPVASAQAGCGNCGGCAMGASMPGANPLLNVVVKNGAWKNEKLGAYFGKSPVVMLIAGTDTASKRAAGVVQAAHDSASRSDPTLVAVFKANRKATNTLAAQLKLGFTTLADAEGQAQVALGLKGLPVLAVFNKAGKLLSIEKSITGESVRAAMDAALELVKLTDPVCGMGVNKSTAAGSSTYAGKTYYFCSASCKQAFDANPKKYTGD